MTHEEMVRRFRDLEQNPDAFVSFPKGQATEVADRLEDYRSVLLQVRRSLSYNDRHSEILSAVIEVLNK